MPIYKRNGLWHWRKSIDGIMLFRSTKTDDKKLATQIARKWDHEAVQQIKVQGERPVSVHDAIDGFLADRKHMKGYDSACNNMKKWKAALPDVPMKSLPKHQVLVVVTKMIKLGRAHNTVCVFIVYWNALNNYCTKKRLSPGPRLDPVKQTPTRFRVISVAEEAAMLAATSPDTKYPGKTPKVDVMRQDNQDILVCLLHLGARITEAHNLKWSDINFELNTILVRRLKRGNDCLLLMTNSLRAVMERRHLTRINNEVFPTKRDDGRAYTGWLKDVVKRSGVSLDGGKITSHTFRHSCATRLLRSGMDITMVQKFLGHKEISSTMVYLHTLPSEVASKAAAVFNGS